MKPSPTVSVVLPEWSRCDSRDHEGLRGLTLDAASRVVAEQLQRAGILAVRERRDGLEIETRSSVGRLSLGPLRLAVHPKLGGDAMRGLFRYAYALDDLHRFEATEYHGGGLLFEDLVAEQLRLEVEQLMHHGLRRAYEPREAWLSTVRGRIDLRRVAQAGSSARAALPCRFHARVEDSALNRVLLSGLRLAARVCSNGGLATRIRRLAAVLGRTIERVPLSGARIASTLRSLDRLTESYRPAIGLIGLLHEGQDPALLDEPGHTLRLPGFLFDMNRFFQALLLRLLRDHLPPLEVRDERGLTGMFAYLPGANPRGRRAPTPRPDFTIVDRGHTVAILDAKYRDLWERSLPREMLYQLALYAVGQQAIDEAVILYPTTAPEAREAQIGLRDPLGGGTMARVVLRPVLLPRVAELVRRKDARGREALRAVARGLALGTEASG